MKNYLTDEQVKTILQNTPVDGEYVTIKQYKAMMNLAVSTAIGEPYAIEAGFSNGDDTYSVSIIKLPLPSYKNTHPDWDKYESPQDVTPRPKTV
jgi:hypothetical protein